MLISKVNKEEAVGIWLGKLHRRCEDMLFSERPHRDAFHNDAARLAQRPACFGHVHADQQCVQAGADIAFEDSGGAGWIGSICSTQTLSTVNTGIVLGTE